MSQRKIESTIRLTTKSGNDKYFGSQKPEGRKPTSHGVTKAVKMSAVAVILSHRWMNLPCGEITHDSMERSCFLIVLLCCLNFSRMRSRSLALPLEKLIVP